MPTQRLREKATRKRWCSTINWTHKSQILYLVHGKLRPPQTSFLCVFLDRCISTVSAEFQGLKLTTLCLGIANTRPLAQASGEHERQQGSKTGPVSQVSFQVKRAGSKFIIKSLHQSAENGFTRKIDHMKMSRFDSQKPLTRFWPDHFHPVRWFPTFWVKFESTPTIFPVTRNNPNTVSEISYVCKNTYIYGKKTHFLLIQDDLL